MPKNHFPQEYYYQNCYMTNNNITNYYCYVLKSTNDNFINRSYTGISNDPIKRLEKHNSGKGAKSTRIGSPYELYCIIGPFTKSEASSFEWKMKHNKISDKEFNKKITNKILSSINDNIQYNIYAHNDMLESIKSTNININKLADF